MAPAMPRARALVRRMMLPDGHPEKRGVPQDLQAFLIDHGPKAMWLIAGLCAAADLPEDMQ